MTAPAIEAGMFSMELREFKLFRALVHRQTGIWLRDGKQPMLASRLSRRLRAHGMSDFAAYYAYVEQARDGGKELGELINCVTTNKTSFFREAHHFEFLAATLVPQAQGAALRGGARKLRIWSAASSTGEEPYSIAITLLEALSAGTPAGSFGLETGEFGPLPGGWEIEVFASDIDTAVLATALRGVYEESALASVSPELRGKFFLRGKGEMAGRVRVKQRIARLVQFQRINLMDSVWPVEGRFDAIFFRNALIYFNQDTQETFLRRMLGYLRPEGYLFLGHSEHVPWLSDAVVPLKQTIYRLRGAGASRSRGASSGMALRAALQPARKE